MVIKTCFHIINSDPCLQLLFSTWTDGWILDLFWRQWMLSIDFIRINISSRMFNGVWFHAILILLYFWHPRYSSFLAFPSTSDLTHSSCSKSAEDLETPILTQAALCSLFCHYREEHVFLIGEGSLLLI